MRAISKVTNIETIIKDDKGKPKLWIGYFEI